MLAELSRYLPNKSYRYFEPMIGGGAMFFALAPVNAVIGDSNPELINLYTVVRHNPVELVSVYESWVFSEEKFYSLRSLDFEELSPIEAAARTIYLNRACFNGLYRVNKKGQFNVPWGKYKSKHSINIENLMAAHKVLQKTKIELGDFREVLQKNAREGDFIFLDPPYVPISANSDFKRYTREQFYEKDHIEMAKLVSELARRGCDLLITNSNHPFVLDLYQNYDIKILSTKRNVNSNGNARTGEDAVIYVPHI